LSGPRRARFIDLGAQRLLFADQVFGHGVPFRFSSQAIGHVTRM
jgi:hypothetical protein